LNQRYFSLDVFRGATVALMILVNNPGNWGHIYTPLRHAPWHGCTPTDLVFPFFLFAVGNALSFVLPRLEAAGHQAALTKVIKRTVLIFLIGLFLNWSPFIKWHEEALVFKYWVDPIHPENGIRFLGVLQRIALCYFFAALILYYAKPPKAFLITAVLLLGYWALCIIGNPTDPYSLQGWFGTAIDKSILGIPHLYKGEGVAFDPEGLMSTLPAITEVLFGFFAGQYIQQKGKNYEMLSHLFIAGCLLVFTGYCWDLSFPINKKIWTSSYVLYTSGLATLTLGTLIYLIEFKEARGRWTRFFTVFGKNPLFIFVLSGFLPRVIALIRWVDHYDTEGHKVYTSALPWFYEQVCKPISSIPEVGSLLYALCLVLFMWSIAFYLDQKKIYIRL
jgi:predicted acyltransferase